jgi:predicted transcriptional regulator
MSENSEFITKLYDFKAKDLMKTTSRDMPFVEKNADLSHIFSVLNKNDHVWVVENKENMHVIGVITESDTILLFSPPYTPLQSFNKPSLQSLQYGLSSNAEDIMSKKPVTASQEEKIIDVIWKMKQHKIKQIPVVDENYTLLGEITLHHFIEKYKKEQAKTV